MSYDELFGALGRRMAPDLVDDGPIAPFAVVERLSRKGIADMERGRPVAAPRAAPQAPASVPLPSPKPEVAFGQDDEIITTPQAPSFGADDEVIGKVGDTPLPRPRPSQAGDGFSASEVPLPRPRPDVGPAPVTGDELVSPAETEDATYKPGLGPRLVDLGKGAAEGAKNMIASGLKGVAATQSVGPAAEERAGLGAAIDRVMAGEDPAQAIDNVTANRPAIPPVTDTPGWKAGEAIENFGQKTLEAGRPYWGQQFTRDVGGGFGSVGAGIGVSLLSPAGAMLMFVTAGQGEAAERAVKAGATPEQIQLASRFGTISGATDVVDALLPAIGGTGKALGFIGRVGYATVAGALAEGGQEGLQQLIQNAIAKGIYKPDQDLAEDVPYNMLIGAIVGGTVSGGVSAAEGRGRSTGIPTPDTTPVPPPTAADVQSPSTLPPGTQTQGGSGGATPAQTATSPSEGEVAPSPTTLPEASVVPEPAPGTPLEPRAGEVAAPPESSPQAPAAQPLRNLPTNLRDQEQTEIDRDRAILREYGYSDDQITDMSAAQRTAEVQDAIDSGIDPEKVMAELAKQDAALGDLTAMFGQDDPVIGTKAAPVKVETSADLEAAAKAAATDYSNPQGEANNRQLGHIKWNGGTGAFLDGSIEVAAGGTRKGQNPTTKEDWETKHTVPYGYWKGTKGADGMHVDAYFGPELEAGHPAYVIDELDPKTGKFRQHKTFVGFPSEQAAVDAYLGTSSKTRDMVGAVTQMPIEDFKAWLKSGKTTKALGKIEKGKAATKPQPKGTLSLLQYIASRGGMRIDPDLRSMALPRNVVVPGMGHRSLLRSGGMSRDQVLEAAREGGYLPAAPADRPDDIGVYRQLLDMMDEENRGRKSYSQGAEPVDARADQRIEEENAAERERLLAEFEAAGVPIETANPKDLAEAERIMREEGLEPYDAFERAVMRRARAEEVWDSAEEFDTVLGEDWWDAVQTDAALQDSAASQEEGTVDEQPRAEEGNDAERGQLSGAREDRGNQVEETAGRDDAESPAETGETAKTAETREQVKEADPEDISRVMEALREEGWNEYFDGNEPYLIEAAIAYRESGDMGVAVDIVERNLAELGIGKGEASVVDETEKFGKDDEGVTPPVKPEQLYGKPMTGTRSEGIRDTLVGRAGEEFDEATTSSGEIETVAQPEPEEEKNRFEDTGHIGGARKDQWSGGLTSGDLDDMTGAERDKNVTKQNVWPRPDYAQLVEDGVEPIVAAYIKTVYDRIPAKYSIPKYSGWKEPEAQRYYIEVIRATRDLLKDVKTKEEFDQETLARALEEKLKAVREDGVSHWDALRAVQPANSRHMRSPFYLSWENQRSAKKLVDQGFPAIEPWQRVLRVFEQLYIREEKGTWSVARKANGQILASKFPTKAEAEAAAKKIYDEAGGKEKGEGEEPKRPHLDAVDRAGPDYRKGKDITSATEFKEAFGFRDVEFGNWAAQDERQKVVNLAYDAFHDLARVLNLSPKALSLDGKLAIAFGSRGRGGRAAAHYEPDRVVINMTKLSGAGSLAHEWAHAVDHYLGELSSDYGYKYSVQSITGWHDKRKYEGQIGNFPARLSRTTNDLMTTLFYGREGKEAKEKRIAEKKASLERGIKSWIDHAERLKERLRKGERVQSALAKAQRNIESWERHIEREMRLIETRAVNVETDFYKEAKKLSGKQGEKGYWARPTEMFARSFEAWVFDKIFAEGNTSQYLAQGVEEDRYKGARFKGNPYPTGEDRVRINAAYDRWVKSLAVGEGKHGAGTKLEASTEEEPVEQTTETVNVPEISGEEKIDQLESEMEAMDESTDEVNDRDLSDVFAAHLRDGKAFQTILVARKMAKEAGHDLDPKQIEEAMELAVVKIARGIAADKSLTPDDAYKALINLYGLQPRLGTRTSTSMREQAFSTPVPLAYVASRLARISADDKVMEPTAGNGALLIEVAPENALVNEINPQRAKNLESQGFSPSSVDAAQKDFATGIINVENGVDVVIANPPFGPVKEEGASTVFDLSDIQKGYYTKEIDHAIALRSLAAMHGKGGRAVLIVGGLNKMATTREARSDGYNTKAKREFYKVLYDRYNVTDHFTVAGELYERQGAGWPVDVIVIDGRGKSQRSLPAVDVPRIYSTWDALGGLLNGQDAGAGSVRADAGADARGDAPGGVRGGDVSGGELAGGQRDRDGQSAEEQPEGLLPGAVSEQSERGEAGSGEGAAGGRADLREPGGNDPVAPPERSPSGVDALNAAFDEKLDELFGAQEAPKSSEVVRVPQQEVLPPKPGLDSEIIQTPDGPVHVTRANRALKKELQNFLEGKDTRPSSEVAKSAVSNAVDSADAAMAGLVQLFGGGKTIGEGINFDRATYEKAKPLFITAAKKFVAFKDDAVELLKRMVGEMQTRFGLDRAGLERMRPYLLQFMEDLQSGLISLGEAIQRKVSAPVKQEKETAQQVSYAPKSTVPGLGTLVPVNMRRSIAESLDRLAERVGDLDQFVAKELGYSPSALSENFAAEQVDALALAIDNIKNGKGFIIGDQTGIGKGRVNAAIIRWAIKNGHIPVFVTEKPNLYGDMYRDLTDIDIKGALDRDVKILMTNASQTVPLDEEGKVTLKTGGNHNDVLRKLAGHTPQPITQDRDGKDVYIGDRIRALGVGEGVVTKIGTYKDKSGKEFPGQRVFFTSNSGHEYNSWADPAQGSITLIKSGERTSVAAGIGGYDVVFTTYNQMQSIASKETARRDFLRSIAPHAVLIFDESHNAGGQKGERKKAGNAEGRSALARKLIQDAKGVFYSSATYAKRPDVMDLYSKTDMVLAVEKIEDLAENIARGGVPMQQAVAAMLAEGGQYIRRERSFDGVTYDTPVVAAPREQYDGMASSLAAINHFSRFVADATEKLSEDIKAEAGAIQGDNATGDVGAESINFTSIMHNVINQMLLALKAKPAVEIALEAIKRGEKPVFTVSGTMESFLTDFSQNLGLNQGDVMEGDFSDVLMKYLERTRTVTVKEAFSDEKKKVRLTDEQLGPIGLKAYQEAKRTIESLDLSDLPISPLDYIKGEMEKAGYKIGEITGRTLTVDYTTKKPTLASRGTKDKSIAGRRNTIRDFNSGSLDAMIINQAGATGLSLHASAGFKDQKRRHMIIVAPEANIDTHMQMLGRIHRTGQVITPTYSQLIADVPAEKRPAAVLAKKMASLNANTTASRGGALTAKDVPDFINEYGDLVAISYLTDHPDINPKLSFPVKLRDNGTYNPEDAMRKLTGRIPLLPLKQQEEVYAHLEGEYSALIEQMKAAGENALEAQTFDLKARTIETTQVVPPKEGSNSPFAAPVNIEFVSVARLGKPFKPEEIVRRVLDDLGLPAGETVPFTRIFNDLQREGGSRYISEYDAAQAQQLNQRRMAATNRFDAYRRSVVDEIEDPAAAEKERNKLNAVRDRWTGIHEALPTGRRVTLKTATGNLTGVVLKVEQKGEPKNPLALSTWKATFAIADASRQITIPFSRLWQDGKASEDDALAIEVAAIPHWIERPEQTLERYESMQSEAREERFIATGNILAGYDWLNRKGTIINYTDEAGAIRQGILLSRQFDLGKHAVTKGRPIRDPAEIKAWLDNNVNQTIWAKGNVLRIRKPGNQYGTPSYTITADKKKQTGGKFFLDKGLTALTGDFYSMGGAMNADVTPDRILAAIERMQQLGAVFTVQSEPPKPTKPGKAQANIRWDGAQLTPAVLERKGDLAAMLQAIVRLVAGPQVRVRFADTLPQEGQFGGWGDYRKGETGITASGVFVPAENLIVLALNDPKYSPRSMVSTAFHEAFHSIEAHLLTEQELGMMRAEDARLRQIVQRAYGFSDSDIASIAGYEIRAMAFEHYVDQRERGMQPAGMHIAIRRAFERLFQLFRQIRNGLRGMGFQTSEDIFQAAMQGEIGQRGRTAPRTMMDVMREMEPEAANIRNPLEPGRVGVAPPPESIEAKLRARNLPRLASISRSLGIGGLRPAEFRTQAQDKFIRVKNLQKAQEAVTGPTPERMDTYGAESLYYGRAGEQIERLDREHIDPLVADIKKRGLTLEQVNEYLYARHAPERNAKVREINPDIESPSGMSDKEAAAIINAIPADKLADYQAIERRVRDLIDQTNETRLRGGLVGEDTLEQWNETYQNYVPLRGFAENTDEDETGGRGGGMDVRGPESRRALGRESEAEGPLYYVILQAQEAIVRAEKDRVGRTMLRYVQANPNPALWTVNTPERKRVVSPVTGMVVETVDQSWKTKDNVFGVKVGGKQHYITFHGKDGKDIARALKNIGAAQLYPIIRFASTITRTFARMQTAWNPEFWVSNLPRDVGEAFINLKAQDQRRMGRLFLKYLIPAMGGAFKGQMGKFEGRFAQAFEEFDKAGGRIRFFGLEDPTDIKANVESKMRRLEGGAWNNTVAAGEKAVEALEIVNGSIENATRLAAYMAAREVGMTQAQAAKLARELTVNFNRKGELGSILSAAYAFGNAALQGTVRMAQAMKSKRVRRYAYGLAALGALLAIYNVGAGGDDDDGTPFYEKIPAWERDKNFIFMVPRWMGAKPGKYYKIPLPYGYLPFHILGTRIASYLAGATTKEKAISAIWKSALDAFDPIGRDANPIAQWTPTVLRPGVHLAMNENWQERPNGRGANINPVNPYGRDHRPDSERHFDSASKFSVAAAKKMNAMTGGSQFKSGMVDVSPGTIDYMLNFLGGGAGRFVANSVATPWKLYQGEEVTSDKAPITRRFSGQVNKEAADRDAYYEQRDKARDAPISLARKAAKRGEPGAADALQDLSKSATQADVSGEQLFDKADRQISKWRAQEKKVREDSNLSDLDRKQKIEEIRAEIATIRNNARKTYKEMQQGR